jgi:hypothetical protein
MSVELVQSGVRSQSDGPRIPLWAIMVGDTGNAEQIAHQYRWLGPCGLNATVWTRNEETATWVRTSYRRPQNVDEAIAWRANPDRFTSRKQGNISLLPSPFARLGTGLIEKVEFIITYDDDSSKAYLFPGTLKGDAQAIVAAIRDLVR